jgi:glycine/D-amino acid oxidase-like deaminating enzyme/nitrite reductase/ring-hydroxylating ferredoxin subunit
MKSEPIWQLPQPKHYSKAKSSGEFDVVVVGGGITGLTAAYQLKQAGKRVCVLERDRLGAGDTSVTTAHLTYVTDLRVAELAKTFGDDGAAVVLYAGAAAIDVIESTAASEQIECDFKRVPGFLCAPFFGDSKDEKSLEQDAEVARRLGFPAKMTTAPYFNRPGVRFPDQAKFHPLKYLAGLAKAIDGDGCVIHEQTEVDEVQDDPLCVVAGDQRFKADYVVIATHVPLMGKANAVAAALFQTKLYPYSSYVIGAKLPAGLVPEACYWDTSDPYYYLRIEAGKEGDYAIFGGRDHKTGQETDTESRFSALAQRLRELIPSAAIDHRWSGQVIETNDGLPFIGETAEKQFTATGFSGNGMTFGTLAGLMACDAALGKENPWQDLFSVHRKKVRGGTWDYLKENVDFPFYFVADRLSRPAKTNPQILKPGEGKILKIDGERVACSCDAEGKHHQVSAYCTHMGCLVRWNQAELTWDCPCHGSRFQPSGEVLAGPAESPLEPVEPPTAGSESSDKTARTKSAKQQATEVKRGARKGRGASTGRRTK